MMIRNKTFIKFIMVTLLCAFLTFNVGKVTRVSAAFTGSVAAIAGAALIATGAVYLSYLTLTGATVSIPRVSDQSNWLTDIGSKVVEYGSGARAFQWIYQNLLSGTLINDLAWEWNEARLKDFTNDFSDTRIIQDIVSYTQTLSFLPPALPFNYTFELAPPNLVNYNGSVVSISDIQSDGYSINYPTGQRLISKYGDNGYVYNTSLNGIYRNAYKPWASYGNYYFIEQYVNGVWQEVNLNSSNVANAIAIRNGQTRYLVRAVTARYQYNFSDYNSAVDLGYVYSFPALVDAPLYNYITGETTEVIPQSDTEIVRTPQWTDPDNDNRPIIPYVPIPFDPSFVGGLNEYPTWGLPVGQVLDLLEELSEGLMTLDAIKQLINAFAQDHGDSYYIYYDDQDTNYFQYYQPVNYNGDYITYNIDVSEVDKDLPVDLNTIQLYTNNRYIEAAKSAALNGGSLLRDLVVFWYDVDPMIVYVIFGSAIVTLIAAFIGKWGHS